MVFFISASLNNKILYGDSWLKSEGSSEKTWIDTSYWDYRKVLVEDGYWDKYNAKRWVDRSYYVTKNEKVWVDTSYTVNQGYWKTENYSVWVESGYTHYYQAKKWVDTSHWETRYRTVTKWIPVNLTVYSGCSSYGWNTYSFAAKYAGTVAIRYNGSRYLAYKYVIDYRPIYGGRVYAVKYHCYRKETRLVEPYRVWVSSGYWKTYVDSYHVDTSHWETRARKVWVDTSYKVKQGHWEYRPVRVLVKGGYWEEYEDYRWVDTSYHEYRKVWVTDGYYAEPLKGGLVVRKEPKYIFTRWHKDREGREARMDLDIEWEAENGEIGKIIVYQDVNRYGGQGTERVDIYHKEINPSSRGTISATVKYDHAGDEESMVHVFLYGTNNDVAHVYFSNPVNGYRSINLRSGGTNSNPDQWLGGNDFGEIKF
ncbi:MAG: hypothetical protein ACQEP5_09205 [Actinomycetota bacterium]